MKKIIAFILLLSSFSDALAMHISGGEIIYEYQGPGSIPNSKRYQITLKLFRDNLGGGAAMPAIVLIGIFNNDNNRKITGSPFAVSISNSSLVPVDPAPLCMTNPPTIDYSAGIFTFSIDLPNNNNGYTASYQTCCRITPLENVVNLSQPAQGEGSTYVCTIPGSNQLPTGTNNSPQFHTQLGPVCYNNTFTFDFGAYDPDSDSLVYSFCNAYNRGAATSATNVDPTAPPYQSVIYTNGYTATVPLGSLAHINTQTGIISGTAPPAGRYVVCVCIEEYRSGVLIGHHRKDFILTVSNCTLASAALNPFYLSCDGFTVNFANNAPPFNIETYFWDFGDGNFSTLETPTHTYAAAGDYTIRLVVNRGLACSDSTTAVVKVYPGFIPDFEVLGQCTKIPLQFNDKTFAAYGVPNSWKWNFGDPSSPANTSTLQNPQHTYTTAGSYNVTLVVTSSKGCVDTLLKKIDVLASPPLSVSNDTLICTIDTLQLHAIGSGTFLWTPNYMIDNVNSANPFVSPDVTTTYRVTLTDAFGCSGSDTVRVRVVSQVTQFGDYDTTICQTDAISLRLNSDALYFAWTPNDGSLNNTGIRNPVARPLSTTAYHVRGSISAKCFADNIIRVKTVPYPVPNAGPDIPICFGASTQLHASGGSSYFWTPAIFLNNTHIANPLVTKPTASVKYIVTVTDTLGCPKPVRDTVIVRVIRINANAGPSDTSVVLGQPLQLNATGGDFYEWSPATWLNNPTIANPVSLPQNNITYYLRVSDVNGCFGLDTIIVRVFFVKPDMYVPSAFTPNGDGKNDLFAPILLGMRSLDNFSVYNRWGQQVYSGSGKNVGWDGTLAGRPQDPATYVWYAEGTDYLNNVIKKKGYVVLIR